MVLKLRLKTSNAGNMQRLLCPVHQEKTPSFIVYANGWGKCFSCGYNKYVGEGLAPHEPQHVEDIEASISYIRDLPVKPYRGLDLPCNSDSCYIVWNDNSYYKRRYFNPGDNRSKYIGAAGHPKPVFIAKLMEDNRALILVEGELNALSIAKTGIEASVISPGGSNDFYANKYDKFLATYLSYGSIYLLVDDDGPGLTAAISLKAKLLARAPARNEDIKVVLMSKDANQLLVESGEDGLREELKKHMEVSAPLS